MMAKNKHFISSRDSKQGRSNSVRECSRVLHGVALCPSPGAAWEGLSARRGPKGLRQLCLGGAQPPCLSGMLFQPCH